MKPTRTLAACLTCALAAVALAVSATAYAAYPEFGNCTKLSTKTGKWEDPECLKASGTKTGEFEFNPLTSTVKFTDQAAGASGFEAEKLKFRISCAGSTSVEGETAGPFQNSTHVILTMRFTKCTTTGGECTSAGLAKGEMITKPLKGWLIYVEKPTKKIGMFLEPETGPFLEAECGLSIIRILKNEGAFETRCVAGELSPVNKSVEKLTLTFAVVSGKQAIKKFEYLGSEHTCELEVELEGGKRAPMTLASTFEISWLPKGTKIEVKG